MDTMRSHPASAFPDCATSSNTSQGASAPMTTASAYAQPAATTPGKIGAWSGKLKSWDDAKRIVDRKGWRPPADDPTVPKLGTPDGDNRFISYSKQVYNALINMHDIKDNPVKDGRRGNRLMKGEYAQEFVEARAMEVVVCSQNPIQTH